MTKLTPLDIAAMRAADRLVVIFNPSNERMRSTGVRLVKEARKSEKTPFPQEQEHTLDCQVSIRGQYDAAGMNRLGAFAMIGLYHNQSTPESSILRHLRAGDEIAFEFHPDMHTNGYVAAAGLHADVLLLMVDRGEGKNRKRFTFEIDSQISPNHESRMIRGLTETDSYRRDGARCRREVWTPPARIDAPAEESAA